MSPGKAIAQAGHAYTEALLHSFDTPAGRAYARLSPGTKICLDGGSELRLRALEERLRAAGLAPCPVIDRHHVEPPHFDGSPILTAIGLGPLPRAAAPSFLRKLKLWTGSAALQRTGAPASLERT